MNATNSKLPFYSVDSSVVWALVTDESIAEADRIVRWAILTLHRPNMDPMALRREDIKDRALLLSKIIDGVVAELEAEPQPVSIIN